VEVCVGTTRTCVVGFVAADFDARVCFLLWLPSSRLSGCCRYGVGFIGSGRLSNVGHLRMLWRHRDRLCRRIAFGGVVIVALTTRTNPEDVIPTLSQVHQLGGKT
jgi:hypothetical protein